MLEIGFALKGTAFRPSVKLQIKSASAAEVLGFLRAQGLNHSDNASVAGSSRLGFMKRGLDAGLKASSTRNTLPVEFFSTLFSR